MFSARKILHLDAEFRMHRGGSLPRLDLAYETWGTLNAERDNAVLLFTGLSPSAHAASSPEDPSPGSCSSAVRSRPNRSAHSSADR
jgi:homoserine acetyltransferase